METENMRMEEKKDKKKVVLISSITTVLLILIIGVSYAFWQKTKVQEDKNVIATSCFDIELEGENPINLASVYPISNEDGMKTTPFTFTITNTCPNRTHYDLNLEALTNTTFENSSIKVSIEDEVKLYSEYEDSTIYFEDSKESRKLMEGYINEGESKTFNLRLWLDEDAPITEQNKVFSSKIIINASLAKEGKLISEVEIGDYISMTPTSTSYTPTSELTGCLNDAECTQNTINPSELNLWRVIRKNEDGTVEVVSEYVSSIGVYFRGEIGYINYVKGLNEIAAQYTNEKYISKTRHMGYKEGTIEICTTLNDCQTDTGYETDVNLVESALGTFTAKTINQVVSSYRIASRRSDIVGTDTSYRGRIIGNDGSDNIIVGFGDIYVVDKDGVGYNRGNSISVRPILTLKADIQIINGDGKSAESAFVFDS